MRAVVHHCCRLPPTAKTLGIFAILASASWFGASRTGAEPAVASASAAPVAADASASASATITSGTNAAAPIYKSIASEMLIGGITAQEEDARQTSLHESLMAKMPPGVLDAPIVVSLTEQERSELQRVQQTGGGGPAVVGRTKPISEEVRFSGLDVAAPNWGGLGPAPI